ncbi:MAG: hypothetical protein NTZ34_00920 [Chloroflexi bacterium]|nr:hypothetical protein [Chloroflexota bacterium]
MKGLAWYCRVVFSLFILICAAFLVLRVINFTPQSLALTPVLAIYIVLTVLCFKGSSPRTEPVKKGWVIFGLAWTALVVVLPLVLAKLSLSYDLLVAFTILTAGYEWNFIVLSMLVAILFIPAVVFFAIRLYRAGKKV